MTKADLPLWRVMPADAADHALDPAGSPEGRFHHDGQAALYASLTEDGPAASLTRYLLPDDPPRVILRLALSGARLFDAGSAAALADLGFVADAAVHRWDIDRERGVRPVTWALSDAVRARGYDGMIYPARLRPELANLVLFRWNAGSVRLVRAAPPRPWHPPCDPIA